MINRDLNIENNKINSYVINENESSPEIYFSHANGFNALTYSSLLKKVKKKYQITSYDMRGHGKTTLLADHDQMKSWFIYKDDLEQILDIKKT